MGAGVSSWTLAREVSRQGQLGVVSGTALDSILVRKLWDGDPDGHARRAMAAFPSQPIVASVLARYFREGGAAHAGPRRGARYKLDSPPSRSAQAGAERADRPSQLRRGVPREGGP